MKKTKLNKKYWPENYKANKNAKKVTYKGIEYLSKAQCMALEGITRKELEMYLNQEESTPNSEDTTLDSLLDE